MKRTVGLLIFLGCLLPTPVLANHEYGGCYEGECSDQEYDQWNSEQNNHNRRNRGAFSPGPFDDSPVDAFNGNTVCLPGSTCYTNPPEERNPDRGSEPPARRS